MNEVYPGYHLDLPLYWRNETSGILEAAIIAYFEQYNPVIPDEEKTDRLSEDMIFLIRDYIVYYLKAPCWEGLRGDELKGRIELDNLIVRAGKIKSRGDISKILQDCLTLGFDPL